MDSPERKSKNKCLVIVIIKMKFLLQYDKPKKKGFATHRATFYDINDCIWWEKVMIDRGCRNTAIIPVD